MVAPAARDKSAVDEPGCGWLEWIHRGPIPTARGLPLRHISAISPVMKNPSIRVLFGCLGWPSGAIEVASWAKHQGLAEPRLVSLRPAGEADDEPDEAFVATLREFRPHVVGFRIEGGDFDTIQRYVALARRHSDAEIVLGGPTPTSHPVKVLENSGADYVFAGEAEESFAQFLELAHQRNSKDLQPQVPGLAYRYGGRTYHNTLPGDGYGRTAAELPHGVSGERPTTGETSRQCLLNRARPVPPSEVLEANRLDWSLLTNTWGEFDSLYFTGGRGCPGQCAFCARLHGTRVRIKSARQLLEEIEAADTKVATNVIDVKRWPLFAHVDDAALREKQVVWAAIYDEDFFLNRRRAVEFFQLWDQSPLRDKYRLGVQTNPCSLLSHERQPFEELFTWIDRLKPMVQVGAESFHPALLARWQKRHDIEQLEIVLDLLDAQGADYATFQLLSDFESTPEEVVDTLRLLVLAAQRHPRMRIASSPFMIPLYDTDVRRRLEFAGNLPPQRIDHFTDYERPHPDWMNPLAAELADLADAELQFALQPEHRDAAIYQAFQVVVERIRREPCSPRTNLLREQAEWSWDQILDGRFAWP